MASGCSPETQVELKIVNQKFVECKKISKLLVDTGSMLSCINVEILDDDTKIFSLKKPLTVSGVGQGRVIFKYFTNLTLENGKTHRFLVATSKSNLNIKFDGIVGSEFLSKFKVIINYNDDTFTMGNSVLKLEEKANYKVEENDGINSLVEYAVGTSVTELNSMDHEIDIASEDIVSEEDKTKLTKVPARSGIFAAVAVNRDGTGIISKFDLVDGIFMADSLVTVENNVANIALINSLEKDVYLNIPTLQLELFDEAVEDKEEFDTQTSQLFNVNFCNREARLSEKLNFSHLNEREINMLQPLMNEFSDVFFLEGDTLSNKTLFEYEIKLKDNAKVVNQKQYKIPYALKTELANTVNKMIKENLIQESTSPWNMPVLMVPKKLDNSGKKKFRMVVDLRKLNDQMVQDVYPLPLINEILDQLGSAKYFSVLDCYQGFYQIGLSENSRKFTSFSANGRKYEFKKLPQGCKNSPAFYMKCR